MACQMEDDLAIDYRMLDSVNSRLRSVQQEQAYSQLMDTEAPSNYRFEAFNVGGESIGGQSDYLSFNF